MLIVHIANQLQLTRRDEVKIDDSSNKKIIRDQDLLSAGIFIERSTLVNFDQDWSIKFKHIKSIGEIDVFVKLAHNRHFIRGRRDLL